MLHLYSRDNLVEIHHQIGDMKAVVSEVGLGSLLNPIHIFLDESHQFIYMSYDSLVDRCHPGLPNVFLCQSPP